jgi:hypothetical protein
VYSDTHNSRGVAWTAAFGLPGWRTFDLIIMEVSSGTWHMDQRINGPKIQHAFSLQLDVMRY